MSSLSDFTDEEIAREYYWRAQKKLGDQRVGIGLPYKDPTCAKCGITLGNTMSYCCPHAHCPSGLN